MTVYSTVHEIIHGTKARSLGFYPNHEDMVENHCLTGLGPGVTYLAVTCFPEVVMKK